VCTPASFIVTKKEVFWSTKTESHRKIIAEYGLTEENCRGNFQLVPIQLVPPNRDYSLPLNKWKYSVDYLGFSRKLPNWYNKKDVEARCRRALKEWRKAKIIRPKEKRKIINKDQIIAIYGRVESIYGQAKIMYICGSALVEQIYDTVDIAHICNSARVRDICGSVQINAIYDFAQIENIWDLVHITNVFDCAQIKNICDLAQIRSVYGSARIENIYGSVYIKNLREKAQVKNLYGSAIIRNIRNLAKVKNIREDAIVCTHKPLSREILKSPKAVIIDKSSRTVKCYVGKK